MNHRAVHLKHRKSTILQLKKNKKQNPSCVHAFSLENLIAVTVILKLYLRDLSDAIKNRALVLDKTLVISGNPDPTYSPYTSTI